MKQLFCVIYISVLLVCFLRLILHLFVFVLIWSSISCLKTCRRDDTIVGDKRYFMSISQWFGLPL